MSLDDRDYRASVAPLSEKMVKRLHSVGEAIRFGLALAIEITRRSGAVESNRLLVVV